MKIMRNTILTLGFVVAGALALEAQPNQGNPGGAPTPIGGVALLVAAGAALGGKKLYDANKKEE